MDYKKETLKKLLGLMGRRTSKKTTAYKEGAQRSGMAGYLPDMDDDENAKLQRKALKNAKPYDRIEKSK